MYCEQNLSHVIKCKLLDAFSSEWELTPYVILHTQPEVLEVQYAFDIQGEELALWWVDLDWTPGAHQSLSITSLLSWTGRRKYNKKLIGQHENRTITDQLLSWAKQTRLGEICFIYYQSHQSRVMRNKN